MKIKKLATHQKLSCAIENYLGKMSETSTQPYWLCSFHRGKRAAGDAEMKDRNRRDSTKKLIGVVNHVLISRSPRLSSPPTN